MIAPCPKCLQVIAIHINGAAAIHDEVPGRWCGASGSDLSQYARGLEAMLDDEREMIAILADRVAARAEQTIKDFPDAKIEKCRERISTANLIAGFARDRKSSK